MPVKQTPWDQLTVLIGEVVLFQRYCGFEYIFVLLGQQTVSSFERGSYIRGSFVQSVQSLQSRLHIAHCYHSRDNSIGRLASIPMANHV